MSKADLIYRSNCERILSEGVWDTALPVRPRWADGTSAHTVKLFGIVNRYNLQEEFPIMTLRRTYYKSCIQELLWIWQKKSNRVSRARQPHLGQLGRMPDGTIGKAYGYQLGVKHQYPEGMLRPGRPCAVRSSETTRPPAASSRVIYNHHDLHEMALAPCAYSMTFNVSGHTASTRSSTSAARTC
jgi:thymidylate synthase